jgi:hypothetical protein
VARCGAVANIASRGGAASASRRLAAAARAADAGTGQSGSATVYATVYDTDCSTAGSVTVGSSGDAQPVAAQLTPCQASFGCSRSRQNAERYGTSARGNIAVHERGLDRRFEHFRAGVARRATMRG